MDVRIRELRTLIPSETLNALSGRNHGTFVEQREGVHGVRLVFNEVDLLPLGLLVNELGGVPETAQSLRLEGAPGVNGRELEGAQNAVGGLLRMRLLRALAERARIAALHCPGVVDTVARRPMYVWSFWR